MKIPKTSFLMSLLLASGWVQNSAATELATVEAVVSAQDLNQKVKLHVQKWAAENNFNGVIKLRTHGISDFTYVAGSAEKDTGRELNHDSVFQTGSVGKLLASAAVFVLAEKGVLDIDAPISRYLPEYRRDIGDKLTLAHLLSNRSGLSDEEYRRAMGKMISGLQQDPSATIDSLGYGFGVGEGIKRYANGDLKFEPGERFDYVNSNWIFVHHILERVTGKPMRQVLREYVFAPADMRASGSFTGSLNKDGAVIANAAIGFNANGSIKTDYPLPPFIGGGTYVNAPDMLSFMSALYSGKLFGKAGLKRFSKVQTAEEDYAFGGRVKHIDGKAYSWQSGSNGATKMVAVHKIEGGFSFVALSNFAQDQGSMFALAKTLEQLVKNQQ